MTGANAIFREYDSMMNEGPVRQKEGATDASSRYLQEPEAELIFGNSACLALQILKNLTDMLFYFTLLEYVIMLSHVVKQYG